MPFSIHHCYRGSQSAGPTAARTFSILASPVSSHHMQPCPVPAISSQGSSTLLSTTIPILSWYRTELNYRFPLASNWISSATYLLDPSWFLQYPHCRFLSRFSTSGMKICFWPSSSSFFDSQQLPIGTSGSPVNWHLTIAGNQSCLFI